MRQTSFPFISYLIL